MVTEEKCWRCVNVGVRGEECKGCGATIGWAGSVGSRKTSDPEEQELDRIAAKYRSEKSGSRSSPSSSSESDEILLLTKIAINTASTTQAVGFLAVAVLYTLVSGFFSFFFYTLGMIPVQTCSYSSCEPTWFLVILAGAIALLGIIGAGWALAQAANRQSSRP
jgi:hypothetical protein